MSPTRRKPDELDALAQATGKVIGGTKREIDALANAVGQALGNQRREIAGEVAPAIAQAKARAAVLAARRQETIAITADWLSRCCDDAA